MSEDIKALSEKELLQCILVELRTLNKRSEAMEAQAQKKSQEASEVLQSVLSKVPLGFGINGGK